MKSMLNLGRCVVQAWATSCSEGIDATERSHGQLRQHLRSSVRARSFIRGTNFMLCQELRSCHLERGGRDPAVLDVSSWGSAPAGTEDASSSQASTGRSSLSKRGLNPYLLFRNEKLSARKALIAPDRKLTQSERQELETEIKSTWAGMSAAEQGSWERVYAGWSIAPPKSPSAGSVVPVGRADPGVYSPWCGQGSAEKPIPVQTIADYISETPHKTVKQLSRHNARVESTHSHAQDFVP